jgi:hypothetical protein
MIKRLYKKVYRNDLCPCGSGKKLKNCTCEDRAVKDDVVDMQTEIVYRNAEPIGQLNDKEDE